VPNDAATAPAQATRSRSVALQPCRWRRARAGLAQPLRRVAAVPSPPRPP